MVGLRRNIDERATTHCYSFSVMEMEVPMGGTAVRWFFFCSSTIRTKKQNSSKQRVVAISTFHASLLDNYICVLCLHTSIWTGSVVLAFAFAPSVLLGREAKGVPPRPCWEMPLIVSIGDWRWSICWDGGWSVMVVQCQIQTVWSVATVCLPWLYLSPADASVLLLSSVPYYLASSLQEVRDHCLLHYWGRACGVRFQVTCSSGKSSYHPSYHPIRSIFSLS